MSTTFNFVTTAASEKQVHALRSALRYTERNIFEATVDGYNKTGGIRHINTFSTAPPTTSRQQVACSVATDQVQFKFTVWSKKTVSVVDMTAVLRVNRKYKLCIIKNKIPLTDRCVLLQVARSSNQASIVVVTASYSAVLDVYAFTLSHSEILYTLDLPK